MIPAGNLALVSARSNKSQVADHFLCSAHIMETKCGESTTQSALFPLYLLPLSDEAPGHQRKAFDSPWPPGPGGRTPNLSPVFVDEFAGKLGLEFVSDGLGDLAKTFGPEDIFNYAYAVFHSPTYRERYAEFLKIDFPRLPLTGDRDLFARLVSLGGELVALHLMQSPALEEYVTTYPVPGSNEVAKGFPRYVPPGERAPDPEDETGTRLVPSRGRVYVNAGAPANGAKKGGRGKVPSRGQFFDGVPPEVWGFHVGGYQVCEKWLKDRRGRALADADLHHYRRIVVALSETMRLMQEIDRAIPSWPIT